MSYTTEINRLMDRLRSQGWRIVCGKHWRCYPPDLQKDPVTVSKSPSDINALKNIRRDLERSGFIDE